MDHLFRGEPLPASALPGRLAALPDILREDLSLPPPAPERVAAAADRLLARLPREQVVSELAALGLPDWSARAQADTLHDLLRGEMLLKKVRAELGPAPFAWTAVAPGIEERNRPLGVLLHIGAGNAAGLSAYSVVEGLLAGNINIVKLPGGDGGLSARLLGLLTETEPLLKPFVYALDVSSEDTEVLRTLLSAADAAAVWGSDEAISGLRRLAPPPVSLIEWGHRLSFAYCADNSRLEEDLQGLAGEICRTDQLPCSAPQCVFYETGDAGALDAFAGRLARCLEEADLLYPAAPRPLETEAAVTLARELAAMEEILGEKKCLCGRDGRWSVLVDRQPELRPSPQYRNVWVMPVRRDSLAALLGPHRGRLQTAGLSCRPEDFAGLSETLYGAGLYRVTPCGLMSEGYAGEPHDGVPALARYVRRISRRRLPPDSMSQIK